MAKKKSTSYEVPVENLKWTLSPAQLSFETTDDIEPQSEIIGQQRGVEAFRFGVGMIKQGYNNFCNG